MCKIPKQVSILSGTKLKNYSWHHSIMPSYRSKIRKKPGKQFFKGKIQVNPLLYFIRLYHLIINTSESMELWSPTMKSLHRKFIKILVKFCMSLETKLVFFSFLGGKRGGAGFLKDKPASKLLRFLKKQ